MKNPTLLIIAVVCVALGLIAFAVGWTLAPDANAASYQRATITKNTDGDTVGTTRGTVRLLGIDTPEVFFGVECGGPEASAFTKRVVPVGTRVRLYRDETQGDTDRYGRLLRYLHVTRPGTNDVSLALLRAGWATVYRQYPVKRTPRYLRAERKAREDGQGIWSLC